MGRPVTALEVHCIEFRATPVYVNALPLRQNYKINCFTNWLSFLHTMKAFLIKKHFHSRHGTREKM
jgi:hypothetical protein